MKKSPISVIMVMAAVLATTTGLLTALSVSETALAQEGFGSGGGHDFTGSGGGGGSTPCF
jgi:hypothetical protein